MKGRFSGAAFTLMELLAVITIIVLLAGLVIGVAGNVRQNAAKKRAQVEIAAIEQALERYKIDNGDYPNITSISYSSGTGTYSGSASTTSTAAYPTAGKALFVELMGRADYSGTPTSGKSQYLEVRESQVNATTSSYLQDPFGYPYGYYYDYDGSISGLTSTSAKSAFNEVVPDIWSTSGETGSVSTSSGNADNYARYQRWVTNWAK